MRRSVAVAWHASFFVLAGALYVVFVLPRWYELLNYWTPALGNPVRIVDGVLLGLCALPAVFTLLRTRSPELQTPTLSLRLLLASAVLQVAAGSLVVGCAVSEFWLVPDQAGQWLFGVYGAAAAVAVLGALAFYLALLAELPPPPPKERRVGSVRRRRRKAEAAGPNPIDGATEATDEVAGAAGATEAAEAAGTDTPDTTDASATTGTAADDAEVQAATVTGAAAEPEADAGGGSGAGSGADVTETTPSTDMPSDTEAKPGDAAGKLRNRRPADKQSTRRFGRRRGGVALDD